MKKEYPEKLQALFANEEFAGKFAVIDDPAKLPELFQEYGLPMSAEEITGFLMAAGKNASDELDPEELDKVSGGSMNSALAQLNWSWGYAISKFGSPKKFLEWFRRLNLRQYAW